HRMPSTDTQLHLVQAGTGRWRNLVVWQHQHAGDEPPPVPVALTATSFGGGRIALTWSDVRTGRAENTYEVYRSTGPDFEPSDDTLIATAIGNTHFDDFSIEPDTEHAYKVRAVNRLGLASDYANTRATSGTGGPTYTLIDASEASAIEAPMEIVPDDDRPYLWAPNGAGRFLEEPPEAGEAEYRFTVEEAGTYSVWGLVIALDKSTDSFYITTELPGDDGFATWSVPLNFAWGWCQAPGEFDFAAGEHSVRLKPRESGTKLAALLITGDMQFVPGGRE
ncbi:MAG TPA: fibronectin type III domain-containing protein, partial [Armatimonadota bacterium]|nr:fibronectin type III domain-containing protein [Armatimonadota bacterium]